MKSLVLLLVATSCLFAEELDLPEGVEPCPARPQDDLFLSANRKYFKEMDLVRAKYRSRLASILDLADAVEIYRLDSNTVDKIPDGQDDAFFPIKPYGDFASILARKSLAGEDLITCRKATVELLNEGKDGGGAFCHYPVHGVRFLRNGEIIFQSSLCWKCQNFYVDYPGEDTVSWVGIASGGLKDFLMKELPVPLNKEDGTSGDKKPAEPQKE